MGDLLGLDRKLAQLGDEFTGKAARRRMTAVGLKLRTEVDHAVARDIGDTSMSGWRRSSPIDISGKAEMLSDTELEISPTKRARGPMRTLDVGRNMGNARGIAGPGVSADGTTARTKSGKLRKVRARKGKRWNGTTPARHTWANADTAIAAKAPAAMAEQLDDAMSSLFTRG